MTEKTLLTPEEYPDIKFTHHFITGFEKDAAEKLKKWGDDIAKVQVKRFVEWGSEDCKEHPGEYGIQKRHYCGICWEALLEEVKL